MKITKIVASICLVLFAGVLMVGCGITTKDGGTLVHTPTITNWYEYEGEQYLDTSITINFDEINVEDIKKITFELYNDDTLLGNAVSEGENLVTLLKDCAQYWEATADTYTEVTGNRILSCAFQPRTETEDNGFWVRSKCTAVVDEVPNKLVVKVVVDNIEYESTLEK